MPLIRDHLFETLLPNLYQCTIFTGDDVNGTIGTVHIGHTVTVGFGASAF